MVRGIDSPALLCLTPDGGSLCAASEVPGRAEGMIGAYAVSPTDGTLSLRGLEGMGGAWASYLSMDSFGRALLLADYGDGRVALLRVDGEGRLAGVASAHQHHGSGPDRERQDEARAHCLVPSPDGRNAYLVCELDSTVAALAYDPAAGGLVVLQTCSLLPDGFEQLSHGADVRIHPSGRYHYVSNRGHDSIAVFAVDPDDGRLALLEHRSSEGRTPRNLTISPDGRFLLVGNQDSDTIVTMPVDLETGRPGPTTSLVETPTPACLVFGSA